MNVDVCDLLAADDIKVDILQALAKLIVLPHGKDDRAWTAYCKYSTPSIFVSSPKYKVIKFHAPSFWPQWREYGV